MKWNQSQSKTKIIHYSKYIQAIPLKSISSNIQTEKMKQFEGLRFPSGLLI